jgi:hypothetical protein
MKIKYWLETIQLPFVSIYWMKKFYTVKFASDISMIISTNLMTLFNKDWPELNWLERLIKSFSSLWHSNYIFPCKNIGFLPSSFSIRFSKHFMLILFFQRYYIVLAWKTHRLTFRPFFPRNNILCTSNVLKFLLTCQLDMWVLTILVDLFPFWHLSNDRMQ